MGSPRLTTQALVARVVDCGEADRVVALLSPDRGKVSALARAARRSRKRFGGALGLFVVGEAVLRLPLRGDLHSLERFDAIEDLSGPLTADLVKVAHGSYVLELARELWPAGQSEPGLFQLVVEALRALASHPPSPSLLRAFELKLLVQVGLGPAIDHCAACGVRLGAPEVPASLATGATGTDPRFERVDFSLVAGGGLCRRCSVGAAALSTVSGEARARLSGLLRGSLAQAAATRDVPASIAKEMRDLLLTTTRQHLGKELRSLQFIAQLSSADVDRGRGSISHEGAGRR